MLVNSSLDCGARPPNPRSKAREWLASFELSPAFEREFRKASKGSAALLDAVEELLTILEKILTIALGNTKSRSLPGSSPAMDSGVSAGENTA